MPSIDSGYFEGGVSHRGERLHLSLGMSHRQTLGLTSGERWADLEAGLEVLTNRRSCGDKFAHPRECVTERWKVG